MKAARPSAPKSVDEYMAAVPPQFRPALKRLRKTIQDAAPEAEEYIGYGMPAYRQDGYVVYFAAFSGHCSLFVASHEVRRKLAKELKPYDTGKGTLRFTPDKPIPAALVKRIVKLRLAENAARKKKRAKRSK